MHKLDVKKDDEFGFLKIIKEVHKQGPRRRFLCQCICGNQAEINLTNLRSGQTKSCGCYHLKVISKSVHGMTGTRLYRIWSHMIGRCNNPTDSRFRNYGGRGIAVCEEWEEFTAFQEWALQSGYADTLTIDRKDVNGGYNPSNCRWATWKQQQNNRTNNHLLTYDGQTLTHQQWSDITGIHSVTIRWRLNAGWSVKKTLETAPGSTR